MSDRPPPLPEHVHRALRELREVEPDDALRDRISMKLEHAALNAENVVRRVPKRPVYGQAPVFLAALTAVALAALVVWREEPNEAPAPLGETQQPAHLIHVELPELGAHWVELPTRLHAHHHPSPLLITLDAPLSVGGIDLPHAPDPEVQRACDDDRCLHTWTAHSEDPAQNPLRVQISEPGHYVFRVRSTSDDRELHEHFVVHAHR